MMKSRFLPEGCGLKNRSECRGIYCTWHYGDALLRKTWAARRARWTRRTVPVPLEPGILPRLQGYSVLDDSASYALTKDGWIDPPRPGHQDLYFFSYGYAYRQALADFFSPVRCYAAAAPVCAGQLVEPIPCLYRRRIPLAHGPV